MDKQNDMRFHQIAYKKISKKTLSFILLNQSAQDKMWQMEVTSSSIADTIYFRQRDQLIICFNTHRASRTPTLKVPFTTSIIKA